MRKSFVCLSVLFAGLIYSCEDTILPEADCLPPTPSSSDTLHGQYTWVDNTGSVVNSIVQFSAFQFRIDALGNPSVFTMKVDTTRLVPERRFETLTATYRLLRDSLYIDSVIFQGNGGNPNVPSGLFLYTCTADSFLFLGGTTPGLSTADTVMRISIRR